MRSMILACSVLALAGCEAGGRPNKTAGSAAGSFLKAFEKTSGEIADQQAADKQMSPTPSARSGILCPLKGQYVSGSNRICNYVCGGSANPVTVSATQVCQASIMKY